MKILVDTNDIHDHYQYVNKENYARDSIGEMYCTQCGVFWDDNCIFYHKPNCVMLNWKRGYLIIAEMLRQHPRDEYI